jgi:hypothetical protein
MAEVGIGTPRPATAGTVSAVSFIDWGAVIAGAVLAAAISFVLLTFGAAIGLSATSPWQDSGASAKTIASLAIFWTMAQQIGSLMIGGYVAGRMRARWSGTAQDEVEFRDGLHGGLVWAVGVVISALLFFSAAGAVAKTGVDAASRTAGAVAPSTAAPDPVAYQLDVLMRPMTLAQATTPGAGDAATRPTPPAAASAARGAAAPSGQADETRAEMTRIFAKAIAAGSLAEADRGYLARLVAQRTGVPLQEAEKRVADSFAEANRAVREAADKARRGAILTGFVTAASLIISLGAAWWAAMRGGHHRDNSIPARFFTPTPRRTVS